MKKIVFTAPYVTELVDCAIVDPQPDEVQVRLAVSSVSSGTERANLSGSKTVAWNLADEETPGFPRYGGYSSAGVVEKVGSAVTGLAVGDRVALSWSTHSELQNIAAGKVCPIGSVSFADAALFHIAIFPLAAIRKCRVELGESAVVMGLGVLGLAAVQLLRAAGATPIIAVDPAAEKREKALHSGADYALDPYAADFAQQVKTLTGGGAKVGIEVTGVGAGLDGLLDGMARFGRVALLGCTRRSDFTIDYYRKVHGPGVTLIGAHTMARPEVDSYSGWWTQRDDMQALVQLTRTGRLQLSSLVDEVHTPEEAVAVYDRLVNEKTFPIVQFNWEDLS